MPPTNREAVARVREWLGRSKYVPDGYRLIPHDPMLTWGDLRALVEPDVELEPDAEPEPDARNTPRTFGGILAALKSVCR